MLSFLFFTIFAIPTLIMGLALFSKERATVPVRANRKPAKFHHSRRSVN